MAESAGWAALPGRFGRFKRCIQSLIVLSSIVLLSACATVVEQHVERAILEALPTALGPAQRYEAHVSGVNQNATHFDQVRATGWRVQRIGTPVLDRVEADFQDVMVDRQAKQLTSIGQAQVIIRLQADDLAAYLQQQSWIEQPTVRFTDESQIVVRARLKLPVLGLVTSQDAEFVGRLIPNGSRLLMRVESVRYGDRAAPLVAREMLDQAINPVIDLARYATPSRIDAVRVEVDALIMTASGSQLQIR